MYYGTYYKSSVGDLFIASDEHNIIGLWLAAQKYIDKTMPKTIVIDDNNLVLKKAITWLDDYFNGQKPNPHDLPIAPIGNDFKQIVWKILLEIPYGAVRTYGAIADEVAIKLGKEKMSAQAVGGAIGHNPISIIIPCHRVIGKNGNLTGYAGGIEKKIHLLKHEGVHINKY